MAALCAIISRIPPHWDLGLPLKLFEILSRYAMHEIAQSDKDNNAALGALKKSLLHQAFTGEL